MRFETIDGESVVEIENRGELAVVRSLGDLAFIEGRPTLMDALPVLIQTPFRLDPQTSRALVDELTALAINIMTIQSPRI